MKDGRIKTIRAFADKLATWIHSKTDKKLYNALMFEKLSELQQRLRRVQMESAQGTTLIFGLDEYRDVWLHGDGDAFLVRDLLCIRTVEKLHELGYFKAHPEDTIDKEDTSGSEPERKGTLQ